MNPSDYSETEKKEIEERVAKAIEFLKQLDLQPACWITPQNVGNDVFALKATAYLQDLRYKNPSPIKV